MAPHLRFTLPILTTLEAYLDFVQMELAPDLKIMQMLAKFFEQLSQNPETLIATLRAIDIQALIREHARLADVESAASLVIEQPLALPVVKEVVQCTVIQAFVFAEHCLFCFCWDFTQS